MTNQIDLARELGITDRRVRQLIAMKLLPEADDNGLYDVVLCRERYRIYTTGTDQDWREFYEQIERDAATADQLINVACGPNSTQEDLAAAGKATWAVFSDLRFAMAAAFRNNPAFPLILELVDAKEGRAVGVLWHHAEKMLREGKIIL